MEKAMTRPGLIRAVLGAMAFIAVAYAGVFLVMMGAV